MLCVRKNDKLTGEVEKEKDKKENSDTPGASPDVARMSVPDEQMSASDEQNSEHKSVTWKDIVIGKRNVQKEEKDLILLKQSQL